MFLGLFEREYGWSRSMLSIGPTLFHIIPWAVPAAWCSDPLPEDYDVQIALAGLSAIERRAGLHVGTYGV